MAIGPSIGCAALRQLDGMLFECTVVDIAYDRDRKPVAWTIQYADDLNTECVTDLAELNFDVQEVRDTQRYFKLFLDTFAEFLPYLTPWEHLTTCCVLCKSCQRTTMDAALWHHVTLSSPPRGRLDRFLNTVLNRLVCHDMLGQTPVKSIVETLVLDGLAVTDQDLWGLLRQTPALKHLSLIGCPRVSFHLFPICQSVQSTLALERVDLYLTFVQHSSVMDVRNKFQHVVVFEASGLVLISPDITKDMLEAYTVDTWLNRICFLDKDRLVTNHPTVCPDELFAWPFSTMPVFLPDALDAPPLASPSVYVFKSPDHATRFLREMRLPSALSAKVGRMIASKSQTLLRRPKPVDPLDAQAQQVFASLHAWKASLQEQVDELTVAVDRAKLEHHVALADYNHAEQQRRNVEKAANRAVLALSLGQAEVDPPPRNLIVNKPGDLNLPPLPPSDAIAALGAALALNQFVVYDGFLGHDMAFALYETLDNSHTHGGPYPFERGVLAGGKTGRNLRYEKPSVRGDDVLWLDGSEGECPPIVSQTLRQLDRLVIERLARACDELAECSLIRKKAMLTCYPGEGASYVKHCDNPNGNGRKVTAILYLNPLWEPVHGGELVLHHADDAHVVAPLLDRLLLFFSDARNPHEVRPTSVKRYALTAWYMDWDEYMSTQVFGDSDDSHERAKIEREIQKFNADSSSLQ